MFNGSEESFIILQNVLLTGISNISFKSSVQEEETKLLGNKGVNKRINKPSVTTCNFSKPYNGKDYLQSLTGITNLSGQFIYKNNAIDFTDAIISSYALNFDSNGFGEINVGLQIFGEMKPTTNLKLSTASGDFETASQPNVIYVFNLDNKNSPIKSFNYEASFDIKSTNNIGSINFSSVDIFSPVVHKITADIEMWNQEVEDITGLIEENKFNRKIDILFSSKEDTANADRILEIQSIVENIESSGVNLDDLDFSIGSCAINSFQFNEASLVSQKLNSSAGEIVQISNEYNAYSIIDKVSNFLSPPSNISCEEHLSNIEDNLNEALYRWNLLLYANLVDFESESTGETDLISSQTLFNIIDFESESIGETGLIFFEPSFFNRTSEQDFERYLVGVKDLILLTGEYNFHNETDFEAANPGQTGLTYFDISTIAYNETDFEALPGGSSVNLNLITGEYNFYNETDFETGSVGETDINLHNL